MESVSIVEVAPRDGLQSISPFIPTDRKIALVHALYRAGVRRIEVTSFVSSKAVPQMADAEEVLAAAQALPGLDAQVLAPSLRQAERALAAGARHLAFVVSASETHNQSNVRRSPAESLEEFKRIVSISPSDARFRVNIATSFNCPHEGPVAPETVMTLIENLAATAPKLEIALCDTTGRTTPGRVGQLFEMARQRYPGIDSWAFHGHDTYGFGVANAFAAWNAGARAFDTSIAGITGGAHADDISGNVATEDLVWMFTDMGIQTRIDLDALISVARDAETLPDTKAGGRVRMASIT